MKDENHGESCNPLSPEHEPEPLLDGQLYQHSPNSIPRVVLKPNKITLLVVLKPNGIICNHTDANCSIFHLRVFLGLSNPHGQRQTSTISISHDNFGERKAKLNLETSRTTQMQLYKCIHIP
jgi:hypothetical protein